MCAGFITISRKLLDWEWADDPKMVALWIHLLFKANFADKKWHGMLIKRGQMITSYPDLSSLTGLTEKEVRTRLQKLEECGCLGRQRADRATLITICKYDDYQLQPDTEGRNLGRQRADKGQTKGSNINNINKEINNITPIVPLKGESRKKPLAEREREFYQTIIPYVGQYGAEMCRAFYDYWREPYRNKDKMRWEGQKTWAVNLRLATWAKREKKDGRYQDYNSEGERERRLREAASVMQDLIENGIPT